MGKILLVLFIMADRTTPGVDGSNRCCFLLFNSLMSNAGGEPRPEAGARELGKDKAQCSMACFLLLPVKNRPCHFDGIRLSTFDYSP
jgi:hypothetical protein